MHHSSQTPAEATTEPPFAVPVGNLNSIFTFVKGVEPLFFAEIVKLTVVHLPKVGLGVVTVKPKSVVLVPVVTATLKLHVAELLAASFAV